MENVDKKEIKRITVNSYDAEGNWVNMVDFCKPYFDSFGRFEAEGSFVKLNDHQICFGRKIKIEVS